jgi:hypothetical protein
LVLSKFPECSYFGNISSFWYYKFGNLSDLLNVYVVFEGDLFKVWLR